MEYSSIGRGSSDLVAIFSFLHERNSDTNVQFIVLPAKSFNFTYKLFGNLGEKSMISSYLETSTSPPIHERLTFTYVFVLIEARKL